MNSIPKGYKQTEVGVIPEEWEIRPLLETVRIANGQVDPKTEPYSSMILVAPDHIESGTGRLLDKQTARQQRAISGKYVFDANDIVYSKIRPYLRKAILADFRGLCSADMYPLKPADDVLAGYMLPILLGHRFSRYAETVSVRSGMPKINRTELADFSIALPPLPEQHAIATALGDADALIESLERLIAKKRQIKQGAMQELLTGQRRLPGFSGKWETKRLGEIGRFRGGSGFPLVHQGKQLGAYPFFKVSDLNNAGNETFMLFANNYIDEVVREGLGAIAIPAKAIVFAKVGAAVFLERKRILGQPSCIDNNMAAYILNDNQRVDNRFVHLCFLKFKLGSLVSTTALPSLSGNVLSAIEFAFPPTIDEQSAIAGVLSDMDAEIEALEARLAKARQVKQGMMQELLTGRIRLV